MRFSLGHAPRHARLRASSTRSADRGALGPRTTAQRKWPWRPPAAASTGGLRVPARQLVRRPRLALACLMVVAGALVFAGNAWAQATVSVGAPSSVLSNVHASATFPVT